MKLKNRILSLGMAVLLAFNGAPPVYAARSDTLTLTGDIGKAIEDMEYGETVSTYRFKDQMLEGMDEGDEVYLVADAQYDSTKAGSSVITLSNFRLEGEQASSYTMPPIDQPVKKQIIIEKRTIKIAPAHPYIFYGQRKPTAITQIEDYTSQLVSGDKIDIKAAFEIEEGDVPRDDYSIQVSEPITVSGEDSDNYKAVLEPEVKFRVLPYEPKETAVTDSDNYAGVSDAVLFAPAGFQIRQSGMAKWSEAINIPLSETSSGTAAYFLRNNNASDTEYYEAVSTEKTYQYTSVQTLPTIKSIEVEKTSNQSILNFLTFGVFGNGSVKVTVEALGGTVDQPTTIYLGENENFDSQTAVSQQKKDGKFYYTAIFTYTVPTDKEFTETKNLEAYAVNVCGESLKSASLTGVSDKDGERKTVDSKPLILDNAKPVVTIGKIERNYLKNKSIITISDVNSGIAKVEYGWDLDRTLCDDKKNSLTGNYQGYRQNKFTDQYLNYDLDSSEVLYNMNFTMELLYKDSVWAKDNKHTLYIRVTDNAGNICEKKLQDPLGSDMELPNITNVEVRKEPGASEGTLRFMDYGIFSNVAVEIAVTADDNEYLKDLYASGVKTVSLNGIPMTKNDDGEYVLTVSPGENIRDMKVTAEDNAGWTFTSKVTDIPDKTGLIKSNDLLIENKAPDIRFQFSSTGHLDKEQKKWYGLGDTKETVTITTAEEGEKNSGLYSVKIIDNGVTKFEKIIFSELDLKMAQTYVIGDMEEGVHTISVLAEDNAGNELSAVQTFFIDYTPPEKGIIKAIQPESVISKTDQWFNKDDVIVFRMDMSDRDSGLSSISLRVNSQIFRFGEHQILSDDEGYYVTADTKNLKPDSQHRYTVSGTVTDVAGNELHLQPLIVYKDFENPIISKLTVERLDKSLPKTLNVLPFGVYSNGTLKFKAYVSDAEFDSGINYVTLSYNGLQVPQIMTKEGEGIFSAIIPSGAQVFQNTLLVTAYDKYNKSSVYCPNIQDAGNLAMSRGKFVMIESVKPILSLSLPDGDGLKRSDGQIWYRTNKKIKLKVQDKNSGIRNIDFKVNGIEVLSDKQGADLLKTETTKGAVKRNTSVLSYVFDTNYLTSLTGQPQDGKYTIKITATDNAGNLTTCKTVYYVDDQTPMIDRIDFNPAASDGHTNTSEFIENLDYGFYFKSDVTVTVNVSDPLPSSGLKEVEYRFVPYENGEKKQDITGIQRIKNGQASLTVPQGFKGQIYVEAIDNAVNRTGVKTTKAYVIDQVSPEINIKNNGSTTYHDASGNSLYTSENSITVVVSDTVSGIKEIGYTQNAENNPFDRKIISINSQGYHVGDSLSEGWSVLAVDANLVTQVSKTFTFSSDDNDVLLTFDAVDNALNQTANVQSEKFTIDRINPIINVVFREDKGSDIYYSQNRVADITVIERNFDESLVKVLIENTFGSVPSYSFTEKSKTEYTAAIEFEEGDFTLDVTGSDLGDHTAEVNFSGGNERVFSVDRTKPVIEENFDKFQKDNHSFQEENNTFNSNKTVKIKVTEHNFDPNLMKLRITSQEAGAVHDMKEAADVTSEVLGSAEWKDSGDVHIISFQIRRDAVYQVEMQPCDLAGNTVDNRQTAVFEIDKTVPVVKAKNGEWVKEDDVKFLDVYPYSRKEDPAPTLEFEDLNLDHLEYDLTVYILGDTESEEITAVKPVRVYLEEDENQTGVLKGSKLTLPDFTRDGVYSLEVTAVDVAGNKSLLNVNTYARMVEQDVLAYILDSSAARKTGLYSFQDQNGNAVSKRPDSFSDIKILVLAKKSAGAKILLRDNNAEEIDTDAQYIADDRIYGVGIYNYIVDSDYFKETFHDDTDAELYLSVKSEDSRIDLGRLHIDNVAPSCNAPEDFKSWHWYYGDSERTITISNISEVLDEKSCQVYDNGRLSDFKYSEQEHTLVFTLSKGWHNVGVILDDLAGNANNIQEKTNIYIGYFWLWIIISASAVLLVAVIFVILMIRKRKRRLEME